MLRSEFFTKLLQSAGGEEISEHDSRFEFRLMLSYSIHFVSNSSEEMCSPKVVECSMVIASKLRSQDFSLATLL